MDKKKKIQKLKKAAGKFESIGCLFHFVIYASHSLV